MIANRMVYIRVDPASDFERERERRNRERDERLSKMRDMMDGQKKEMDREAARKAEKYYGAFVPRRLP